MRRCAKVGGNVESGVASNHILPLFVNGGADAAGSAAASGRRLRFLANVDPVDVARAVEGLDPETTLVWCW